MSKTEVSSERELKNAAALATRMRAIRKQKGFMLDAVAKRAGLDKGYLSRIERGQKTPSIATLLRIAEALDVQMGHLFGESIDPEAITVVRGDAHVLFSKPSADGPAVEAILPPSDKRRLTLFLASPGRSGELDNAEHPGDEMIYVLAGTVEIEFADRTVQLSKGDCVHFDGHLTHQMRDVGNERAQVFVVIARDLDG